MVLTKTILPKKFEPPGGEGPVDPRIARAAAKEERQERRNRRRHPETFSNNQIKLFFVLCDIKMNIFSMASSTHFLPSQVHFWQSILKYSPSFYVCCQRREEAPK